MAETASLHAGWKGTRTRFLDILPKGHGLPQREWEVRHRAVVIFVLAHAVGLAMFGMARGWSPVVALGEGAAIAVVGMLAAAPVFSRKVRSGLAALGCVMSSAILVQFWSGVIEAHFHFFVVVALISLYQDWVPFLLCISFVAFEHGAVGTLLPTWVYNHPEAVSHPWTWAAIHAVLVLAESVALIVVWHSNEKAREETDRILRSAGEGIVGVDADGRVTFANPAAARMAGDTNALLGRSALTMLLADDGRPVLANLGGIGERPTTFTCHLQARSAPPVPVEVLCTPIIGSHGLEGAVLTLRDISDRLRAETQRLEAIQRTQELEQLKAVNAAKNRFLNIAAHELNTPLTPIKVQMHLLKKRAQLPPWQAQQDSIGLLDRNFKRLSNLVQDLLDSTRLQSGNLPMRARTMDMAPILRDVADSFAAAAAERGIEITVQEPTELMAEVDPDRVVQAVSNLLSNALKFTRDGGKVRLVARQAGDQLRVEIVDTGVGMTQEQLARLFLPFSQVHEGQVAGQPGSGLGLFISAGIAQAHHGRIWAESDGPGKGSRFILALPRIASPGIRNDAAAA